MEDLGLVPLVRLSLCPAVRSSLQSLRARKLFLAPWTGMGIRRWKVRLRPWTIPERRVLARPAPPPQQDFRENHEALQALSGQALAGQAPTRRSRKAKRRAAASLPGEIAASRFCSRTC